MRGWGLLGTVPRVSDTPGAPLPPPVDPWAGRDGHTFTMGMASIPARTTPAAPDPGPQVVYVERPRRRRWPWVLGVLTALSLACCGVLTAVTAPMREQWPVRAEIGGKVAGLVRDDSAEVRAAANELIAKIHKDQDVRDAAVAKLDEPKGGARPVVLIVATRFILDPGGELDKALDGVGRTALTDRRAYAAGARGGHVRCGNTKDTGSGEPVVACAWTDHGSLGIGLFYGRRSMDDSAALLRRIRDEVLVKG
ncbi:hypothetical protein GCM10009679_55550 [Saccharothrix algeriensis]|uniref:Uncharacterized protein n=1 Tax=Catellatospora bangladeshensis TaxID=310355 RepID=A0A8J3JHW7_9ACTN|nr:hypothetical protein Cba03nite_65060 [Catellatospora bangladeshensis]